MPLLRSAVPASTGTIFTRDRRLADRRLELGLGDVLALEVLGRDRVIEIGDRLDHLIARVGGRGREVARDLGDRRARRSRRPRT